MVQNQKDGRLFRPQKGVFGSTIFPGYKNGTVPFYTKKRLIREDQPF